MLSEVESIKLDVPTYNSSSLVHNTDHSIRRIMKFLGMLMAGAVALFALAGNFVGSM